MIIAHQDIKETVNKAEIKDIFLGRRTRWKNNTKVHIVLSGDPQAVQQFALDYIDKSQSQFIMYWKMQVFTGTGRMPKSFKQPAELMQFIASTQGSIGFILWLEDMQLIDGVTTLSVEQ